MTDRHFPARWTGACLVLFLAALTAAVSSPNSFVLTADAAFENFMVGIRTPFLLNVFDWITYLGNPLVVAGIAVIVGVYLLLAPHRKSYEAGFAVNLFGASV